MTQVGAGHHCQAGIDSGEARPVLVWCWKSCTWTRRIWKGLGVLVTGPMRINRQGKRNYSRADGGLSKLVLCVRGQGEEGCSKLSGTLGALLYYFLST
jgi:hypothetical protein